jgi:hypothetical protein
MEHHAIANVDSAMVQPMRIDRHQQQITAF